MTDSQPARGCDECKFCGGCGECHVILPDGAHDFLGCSACSGTGMAEAEPVAGGGESIDALKIRELCHNIIRACKATDGGPFLAIADEAARRILSELKRAAIVPEGDDAISAEMDKLSKAYWDGKPSRIVKPVAGGGGVSDEMVETALRTYTGDFYDQLLMQDEEMIANTRKDMRAALVAALQVKP